MTGQGAKEPDRPAGLLLPNGQLKAQIFAGISHSMFLFIQASLKTTRLKCR
jgi:hypothetical protein